MSSARLRPWGRLPRPLYRARQFLSSLRPHIADDERRQLAEFLDGPLLRLFESMPQRDQRHCLDVSQALRRQGCDDRDLLAAALLHDVGKGDVGLLDRVAFVALNAVSPHRLERLAASHRGLAALLAHPKRGAELVAAAGAPEAVARLVAGDPGDPRLALLQAADDSC
ncbi:MAG: HD domain-containing protein [Dehalococcoidia bacterium]